MRKFASFRRLVLASVVMGLAVAVTALLDLEHVALALLGIETVLLTALLVLLDRRARAHRPEKGAKQLFAIQRDVRRLVVDVEETQRRLITSIETLRLESAERARKDAADSVN